MELVAFVAVLGLVGVLAVRFGADSRPGVDAGSHRWADLGQTPRSDAADRELAVQLRSRHPAAAAPAPVVVAPLDSAAFAAVGLRLETPRARAFAAALCQAAAEERGAGDAGWAGRAVDRLVRSVDVAHLAGVADDLGMGRLVPADGAPDAGAVTTLQALLTHLFRDRLQDALRVQAGLRPFWPWEEFPADVGRPVAASSEAPEPAVADPFAA